jgi:hypothetical protein
MGIMYGIRRRNCRKTSIAILRERDFDRTLLSLQSGMVQKVASADQDPLRRWLLTEKLEDKTTSCKIPE